MYTGKFTQNPNKKNPRGMRRSILLTVSVLVLCLGMIGGSVAWLVTSTKPIENVFTVPGSDISIDEKFDLDVKNDVRIHNDGQIPVYVRAKYVITYKDREGKVFGQPPKAEDYTLTSSAAANGWLLDSATGFWYYSKPLEDGKYTPNLIDQITIPDPSPAPAGYALDVHIIAQSVQAEGTINGMSAAASQGWPVSIAPDGTLTLN